MIPYHSNAIDPHFPSISDTSDLLLLGGSWGLGGLTGLSSAGSLSGRLGGSSLSTVILGHWLDNGLLSLWLDDGDGIWKSLGWSRLALWVRSTHDLDLDTEDTLAEENVARSGVDEVLSWLTRVDHETVGELHGLGAGSAKLTGDDNLASLGARLHDETEDTVASAADGETVEKLVAEGLALGDSGKTAVLDLGGIEGDGVLWEFETLLDQGGELADAATLLSENLLGVGGADDDVGDGWGDADLDSGVSLLGQLTLEELVQLSVEDTIGDELPALGAVKKDLLAILLFSRVFQSIYLQHRVLSILRSCSVPVCPPLPHHLIWYAFDVFKCIFRGRRT